MNYGYNSTCAPSLSGFFGLGATTPAQRRATALARRQGAVKKRAEKKAAKVAGKTVHTSHPEAAAKIHAAVAAAQAQIANVTTLANRAKKTRSKVDIQKALVAAHSAGNFINTLKAPVQAPPGAAKLRGMGYMGACIQDQNDPSGATYTDDQTGVQCDPNAAAGGGYVDPNAGGVYGGTAYPVQQPTIQPNIGINTGLVPGFGAGLPTFGSSSFGAGLPGMRACRNGSNLPRCIIYQMAVDEQQQYQFVFTILQQMYAQLLSIVQQLLSQLQSAQQQPYAGQQPFNPYGQPYDPNNPYGQGQGQGQAAYSGAYPGPGGGYPGSPYYAGGGGDSSVIPPGYGDAGGDVGAGIPSDASQVFPGPGSAGGGGYPMQSPGGPPPGLVSSDSLPSGVDQTNEGGYGSSDDAGNLIPTGGQNFAPAGIQPVVVQTPGSPSPQIIVLQQGPGQSPYADAGIPAGDRQNQSRLDPPEHDEAGLTGYGY